MVEPPLWPVSWGWFGHLQRSQRKKEKKKNCEGFGPRTTPMAKAYKRKEKRKKKRKKKEGLALGWLSHTWATRVVQLSPMAKTLTILFFLI
jgi:hypothetical protein